jgi:hypothetical protein
MKRYVVLTVGYQSVALPYSNGAELSSLVSAISEARQVNPTGYGEDQKYVPVSDEPVQFQLVDAARVTIGDEVSTLKAKLSELEKDKDRWITYYNKANELEKQLKALQTPPSPVNPAQVIDPDSPF